MLRIEDIHATVADEPSRSAEARAVMGSLGCALLLAACSASAAEEPQYRAMPLPQQTFAVPQGVFAAALQGFPEGREGRQNLELSVSERDDGTYLVVLTRAGFLDDSVNGDQQRAVLTAVENGWRVTALGERWRCQHGRGPSGWTTSPCN